MLFPIIKKKKYKNPNKYIIKNNKFIREFDKLYKNINDPWNQKKNFEFSEQFIFCISGLILLIIACQALVT